MFNLEKLSGPAVEPVTLGEAKEHCRITTGDDDDFVDGLISTAREFVEKETELALIATRYLVRFDAFPEDGGNIELPIRPLLINPGNDSWPGSGLLTDCPSPVLRYWNGYDEEVLTEVFADERLFRPIASNPPTLQLWDAYYWPILRTFKPMPVEVEFLAGFGFTADKVPKTLKQAIKLLVGHWYANRETASQDVGVVAPFTVDSLLRQFNGGGYA